MTKRDLNDKQRQEILKATLQSISKDFGVHGSQVLGETKPLPIARTSFGSYAIDDVTGGGNPRGRIIEIYGPESSGKTTVALHAIAEAQKEGGVCVFIDAENALDINYAEKLGVNIKDLIVGQPDSAEECLQIAERWINSGICDMVVIDSVPAMVSRQELNGDIGDSYVGVIARLMSQSLKKLAYGCNRSGTNLIFINQIREKVGVMFGNPETTPGGRALKFYATIRLEVRPSEITKTEGVATSRKTKIKVVKNKVAPPFRETTVDIEFGEGISKAGEILDYGVDLGILYKKGSWYWYGEERIGNGRPNSKQALNENPEFKDKLDKLIRSYLNPVDAPTEYIPVDEEKLEEQLVDEIVEVEEQE
jgi:recombination protein RecA